MSDFAVDLRECLLAAHGEDGLAESHENPEQSESMSETGVLQKSQRSVVETEIRWSRPGRKFSPYFRQREDCPTEQQNHHHGSDLHYPESFVARFFDSLDVLQPVIQRLL